MIRDHTDHGTSKEPINPLSVSLMYHDPSDLGSLIRIRITTKERNHILFNASAEIPCVISLEIRGTKTHSYDQIIHAALRLYNAQCPGEISLRNLICILILLVHLSSFKFTWNNKPETKRLI